MGSGQAYRAGDESRLVRGFLVRRDVALGRQTGTPLAAVALAVELLLFEWKPRSFKHRTLDDLVSDASAVVGYPGEVVADLVNRMVANDVGRVPIVDPATRRIVGLVARKDLMRVRAASRLQDLERQSFFRLARFGAGQGAA